MCNLLGAPKNMRARRFESNVPVQKWMLFGSEHLSGVVGNFMGGVLFLPMFVDCDPCTCKTNVKKSTKIFRNFPKTKLAIWGFFACLVIASIW